MRRAGRDWAVPGVVGVGLLGIYLAGAGAVLFRAAGSPVAFWWPAAGLSVALVAALPRRWAPVLGAAIVLVSALANLSGGQEPLLSAAFGVANGLEALLVGLVLKDQHGRLLRLNQLGHLLRLVVAALLGAVLVGVIGGTAAALLDQSPFLPTLRNLVASHATAITMIVPVAMAWRQRVGPAPLGEQVVQVGTLALAVLVVFGSSPGLPLSFLVLPVLVWAAWRLDPRTVTVELLALSVLAVLLTARGRGAFGQIGDTGLALGLSAPVLQGFLLTTALVVLPLSLAVAQRAHAVETLSDRERLFRRNFTESMTGMVLLARRDDGLEVVDANDTALRLLDDGQSPVIGRSFDGLLTDPEAMRGASQAMSLGELDGWRGQLELDHLPGSSVKVALAPLTTGEEATYAAQLLDVTAEHAAQRRSVESERLTSATLDTTNCIILVTDMTGTVVRVNRATTAITGFAASEMVGRPVWETIVPSYRVPIVQAMFAEPDGSAVPGSREANACTSSGETLRVVWNNALVRDEGGRPRYAVMTGVDVTAERTTSGLMTTLFQAGISTAIIGIDGRGRIMLFNSGAEALLGRAAEEWVGTAFTDLLLPEELAERTGEADAGWTALRRLVDGGQQSRLSDWTWRTAAGGRRTVSMTLTGRSSQFGPQAGYLVVGRDVTEERHAQEMLMSALAKERIAADRLRQLDVAKNEFVSTVSHELRTPVTSIVGYAELLADGSPVPPDPEQVPLLDIIARNGARLIDMCNDLLTLAGLDGERPVWDRDELDLRVLVAQVEDSVRPMLRDRRLAMVFTVPDGPVVVRGNAVQLERVLQNLLSNALKFTPGDGLVATALERDGDEAVLTVSDSGIGIPAAEQAELFQKFFRASTAQDLAIQGTGLGLSIVAGIVTVHNGRIGVESEPGVGTTFTVRLPLARTP